MILQIVEQMPDRRVYGALLPYSMMHPSIAEAKPKVTHRLRQTQTQTKFIQQKYIQVPYQVYMSFLEIQITI